MTSTFHKQFTEITDGAPVAKIVERTGIDQGSISRYLQGTRKPNIDRLVLIAKAYGVTTDHLLGVEQDAA